jgi:DHA2 family multidrug resistance protein-like MFS transporter
VAGQLPDHLATTVVVTARQAFVHGMQLSSAIAAIVAVGLAILALITLHDQPSPSQTNTNTDTENDRARGEELEAADG